MKRAHAMPFGAAVTADGVRFRLWAPAARHVSVRLQRPGQDVDMPMAAEPDGWFGLLTDAAVAGNRYLYVLDEGQAVPDPASRFQPDGVHGPSEIVDPGAFEWADGAWRGRAWEEAVIYELHVGTFTTSGDYAGVVEKLDHLVDLGVTAIELMPLAQSPGRRNWGYDGVHLFAPHSSHGRPEALKHLVQRAHAAGLMVLLDVVYNHFGPEGNHLHRYAPQMFTERHRTPWGAAIDFEGPGSRVVRDFVIHNALYWMVEYDIDGLRLDAVHAIFDDGRPDILTELAEKVRGALPPGRSAHLVLENDDNAARHLERDGTGRPRWYTAQWNDDSHHVLHGLLTGESAGYYGDYADRRPERLGRILTEGFDYQGQPSAHRGGQPRGQPSTNLPLTAMVNFLQNHDQIGNRAFGERIAALAEPEAIRAATAILLIAPPPPLLFMGQEWGASQPFLFFCDVGPDLADSVREGRRREFARFPEFADPEARERIPDPLALDTFARCILNWQDLVDERHAAWLAFHRQLLVLRQREIVPRLAGLEPGCATYALLGDRGLQVGWRLGGGARLALVANLSDAGLPFGGSRPPGRCLHASHEDWNRPDSPPTLSPWSVAWFIDTPKPPHGR